MRPEGMRRVLFLLLSLSASAIGTENLFLPKSFFGNFEQTVTSPSGKKLRWEGKLVINTGSNESRWAYDTPAKKDVCSDGSMVIIVDFELEQAQFYRKQHVLDIKKIFKGSQKRGGHYISSMDGVEYHVSTRRGRITEIHYKDKLENSVAIRFSNVVYGDVPIPTEYFKCEIPKGFEKYAPN